MMWKLTGVREGKLSKRMRDIAQWYDQVGERPGRNGMIDWLLDAASEVEELENVDRDEIRKLAVEAKYAIEDPYTSDESRGRTGLGLAEDIIDLLAVKGES